jgi:hypothetical protein
MNRDCQRTGLRQSPRGGGRTKLWLESTVEETVMEIGPERCSPGFSLRARLVVVNAVVSSASALWPLRHRKIRH